LSAILQGVFPVREASAIWPTGPDVAFIQLDDLNRDTARWQERNNPGRIQLRPKRFDEPS
jgi:hypothetical protein